MFTILRRTATGWTDIIGTGENSWATEVEAADAVEEMRHEAALEQGIAYAADWKIVPTEELSNYDLVA